MRFERGENEKQNKKIAYITTSTDLINQLYNEFYDNDVEKAAEIKTTEEANWVDWSTYSSDSYYYSFADDKYYEISFITDAEYAAKTNVEDSKIEEGFKAVTVNVPNNFRAALRDPVWGLGSENRI